MIERRGGSRPAFTLDQAPQVQPFACVLFRNAQCGRLSPLLRCAVHMPCNIPAQAMQLLPRSCADLSMCTCGFVSRC